MGGGMGAGMGWNWFFWFLVVAGIVVLVFVLVKALGNRPDPPGGSSGQQGGYVPPPTGAGPLRAREILQERFARGEISAEEYRQRLRTLEEGGR